jgi:transposase InsO family protein
VERIRDRRHGASSAKRTRCSRFYQLLDKDGVTDDIHLFNEKVREWEDYYNYHRPHDALNGQTQFERLIAKTRANVLPRV